MKIIIDIPKKAYEIIKAEKEIDWLGVEYILDCIKSGTPTEESIVSGKWEWNGDYICSKCGGISSRTKYPFCPNCGAKMIESEETE